MSDNSTYRHLWIIALAFLPFASFSQTEGGAISRSQCVLSGGTPANPLSLRDAVDLGLGFYWESCDNGTFTGPSLVAFANNQQTFNMPAHVVDKYYRRVVPTPSGTPAAYYSNVIKISIVGAVNSPTFIPTSVSPICLGTSSFTVSFTTLFSPTKYSIIWDAAPSALGFQDVIEQNLPGVSPLTVNVPTSAPVGSYFGTLVPLDANGCSITGTHASFTFNDLPAVSITPSGPTTFCAGGSVTLTATAPTATSWAWGSGENTQSIFVNSSSAKSVTVTDVNGCSNTSAATTVTVNPLPTVQPITGNPAVCVNATTTLADVTAGGSWTSSAPAVATINAGSGVMTGVAAGTTTISYSVTDINGCNTTVSSNKTVNALPAVAAITGNAALCVNATTTLANATEGGSWSSSAPAVATINVGTGLMTGVAAGTTTISYSLTDVNGCNTTVTSNKTVNALPAVASITGNAAVCVNATASLADATAGGSWASSAPAVATINAGTGLMTGVASGTTTISYSVTDLNGCNTTVTSNKTVNALPAVAAITGNAAVCVNATTSLADATAGGSWASSAPAVATINAVTGLMTGVAAGTTTISYSLTDVNGCNATVTSNKTVNALPTIAAISGAASVCANASTTLTNATTGGSWSSNTPAVATINAGTGLMTGVAAGTTTISYSVTDGNGCSTTVTTSKTVNALPTVAAIAGAASVCANASTTLTNTTTGGSWSSSVPAVATINAGTGLMTGVAAGTTTISYSITNVNGCTAAITSNKTVNPLPAVAAITGAAGVCLNGVIQLSSATAGGSWSSASPAVASINASTGLLTAVSPGTASISYTVTNSTGCTAAVTASRSIFALPATPAITGTTSFCAGSSTTLSTGATGNYLWSNGATTRSISVSQAGNYTLTVTDQNNCQASSAPATITAIPLPAASMSAGLAVCQNAAAPSLTLTGSNGTAPYIFSYAVNGGPVQTATSSGSTASVKALTGTPGSFIYQLISVKESSAAGCSALAAAAATVTVNPLPSGNIQSAAAFICADVPRTLTASGGSTYQWYLNQQVINGATVATFDATQAGNYSAQLISAQGCVSTAANSIDLLLYSKPVLAFAPDKRCLDLPVNFQNQSVSGSSGNINWSWNFGDGGTSAGFSATHNYSKEGMYTIRLTADNPDCPNLTTVFSNSFFIEAPTPGIRYAAVTTAVNKPVTLHARNFGAQYLWQPPAGLNDITAASPVATLQAEKQYTVQITSAQGCVTTDTVLVKVFGGAEVFIPQGFTPNGDGRNDRLFPTLVQIQKLNYFKIFNRWGNLVFQTTDDTPANGWDGRYNGKEQPTGSYTWILEAVDTDGNIIRRSGNTLLLR